MSRDQEIGRPVRGASARDSRESRDAGGSQYPPSPVPADQDLAPGELPFTAWGQFGDGALDLRVFDQDRYWVDQHGRPNLLDDMARDYLEGVLIFLHRKADHFFASTLRRALMSAIVADLSENYNQGQIELWKETAWLLSLGPERWLEQTTLVRSLVHRLEQS